MKKLTIALLSAAGLAGLSGLAFAGDGRWGAPTTTPEEAVTAAEALGLGRAVGVELDDGVWEVRVEAADGSRRTVHVDASTRDVLSPAQPGQTQLGAAEVMARLAAAGYTDVRELDRDDGYWEAEVRGAAGFERDVRIHPLTGAISEGRWDD
jgi:uncharacterized membrane protein YkoI